MFNRGKLKEAMTQAGLTQKSLAKEIGKRLGEDVTVDSVKSYTRSVNPTLPPLNKIQVIADILGIKVSELWGESQIKTVEKVPVIGEASCGTPASSVFEDNGRSCYYNGDFWHNELYCVIASGDSMAPDIEDGDEVICDPKVKPENGDMVHYKIGNESAIKIYVKDDEANIIQFVPYNASEVFKIKTVRLDDFEAENLTAHKVVAVNKLKLNNRKARLRMIGRG
jgi:repressor LexA